MAAETQYTGNTGMVAISTANTNLDGTGTLGTVLTGGSNGTLIKAVTIKAQSTTTEGMVRLFIYDGVSSTKIFREIYVPPMTPTGTSQSFEATLILNYYLPSGYVLKASTQNAETFNIIAEGLDWSYYAAAVRPESTNYTSTTSFGAISTANPNRDGTGTIVTVLTAGTSANGWKGCAIECIYIKAIVTTTEGMVRIYIQDSAGSNTKLLTEIFVPDVNRTGTVMSFEHKIDFPDKLQIAPGYKLLFSTENAETFHITVNAMNWKYPSNNFVSNYTAASGTSVITEELLHSLQVPATMFASGNLMKIHANIAMNNNANTKTFRIYVNTSNTLTAATKIATLAAASLTGDNLSRLLPIITDTSIECFGGATTSTESSYGTTTGTSAAITVPSVSAGFWVLISGQKAVAGDTDTIRWSMVSKVF